jgi:uncharacterized surface protein with fasciclin (FAS1) repeats
MYRRALAAAGACAAIALALTGCSSSGGSSSNNSTSAPRATSAAGTSGSAMAGDQPFGSACGAVPKTGAGSFDGMATDPVATAASHNPVLSTLVTAVQKAGLVDTLNSQQAITVFAPYNAAFAKIPAKTLNSVLADKKTLTSILTYHVLAGKIAPDQLPGTHKTLEGATVTVKGTAPSLTVGPKGTEASVICGNVQTANATVYIIDSVMMPPAN